MSQTERPDRSYRGKRVVDLAIVAAIAIPAAVIGAACAAVIKLTSRGPVFFRQERVGLGGRPFRIWKFRTMVDEPDLDPFPDEAKITSAGRWLRRLSLDELPQLINVARGEMSIVGPRPTLPYQVERYDERQRGRLSVRPGVTGLAQVRGRNAIQWANRIELDLAYVREQSPSLDLRVMAETLGAVVAGSGAGGHPTDDPIAASPPPRPRNTVGTGEPIASGAATPSEVRPDDSSADDGPSISIIVATYNANNTIERCLRSVVDQTHDRTELIVIDGGSTDGTRQAVEAHATSVAYWESKPDRGIYHAWNKGLAHATGEWIGFLGADDYFWSAEALAKLAAVCRTAYPTFRIVYGRVALVDEHGKVLVIAGTDWSKAGRRFRDYMTIPHTGLLHHRSVFADHGTFDESYQVAGDYELLLRELKHRPALFARAAGVTVAMGAAGVSNRPDRSLLMLTEARRAQRANGISRPGRGWLMRVGLIRVVGADRAAKVRNLRRSLLGKTQDRKSI